MTALISRGLDMDAVLCSYELTPVPAALFDDNQMMRKQNKALLKTSLVDERDCLKEVSSIQASVVDGGALSCCF